MRTSGASRSPIVYHRGAISSGPAHVTCNGRLVVATLSRMNTRAVLLTLFLVGSVLWAQDTKAPDAATQHAKVPASSQQGNTPVAAASSGTVPVGREGHHHQLLDNQYVRAYYVEIAPHQSTLMHHHGIDYLAYSIGHSVISVTSGDGKATNVVLENGELRYTPSGVVHT